MKTLAIIPARGGSKGIVGKNIKKICGKTLIEYSIDVSLKSNLIDQVVVSSDCDKILEVSRKFNVFCHKRDVKISQDKSPVSETIDSVLMELETNYDLIILLQPTSPIRFANQIDDAISLIQKNNSANSLISVCEMDDVHPARMYWGKNGHLIEPIMPEFEKLRRQDIPKALYRNGSIYIVKTEAFVRSKNIMIKPSIGFVMPYNQLLNIDEERDLIVAEPLMKFNKLC